MEVSMSDPSGPDIAATDPDGAVSTRAASRKAIVASMIGNAIEWFDYGIYGYLAPVFAVVFFPKSDQTAALLSTYAVLAVSFLIRPLGGLVMGRHGDRRGRKFVLSFTILLMSGGTFAIGVLPGYAVIGVAAPALLLACRLVQGFGAGGEYSGAVSFVVEHGPPRKRAYYGSWVAVSVFVGLLASSGFATLLTSTLSEASLNSWGWRIPFLIAAPMGLIGLYIRSKMEDTPEFKKVVETSNVVAAPVTEAVRTSWKPMTVFFAFAISNAVGSYLFSSYLTTYLTTTGGHPKSEALLANSIALMMLIVALPFGGKLCDWIGRKPCLLIGIGLLGVLILPSFMLADQPGFGAVLSSELVFAVALFFISPVVTVSVAEMFPAAVRVTAGAITYNLAFTVFGGTTPFIATALVESGGALAPAYYVMAITLFSFVVVLAFKGRLARHASEGYRAKSDQSSAAIVS
ncbi:MULTISPECIES: MFS transporter [unclassified Streptomyces]|uniref:MFS transporter n=2 Tax=unclassified Streptomyces TaxID=2593676 RepID=UPI002E17CA12|nr:MULTISPECIES: MFS transporter [unclassified Streptomyces]